MIFFVPLGCEKKKLTWKDVFSECFSCNVISCKINFVPKKSNSRDNDHHAQQHDSFNMNHCFMSVFTNMFETTTHQ